MGLADDVLQPGPRMLSCGAMIPPGDMVACLVQG
jgi:hypothetical protein